MDAHGLGRAVADHVVAHLATRRLDSLIMLARWNGEAFGHDLEVIDEGFHLRLHLLAVGQNDFRRVGFGWTFGHAFEGLPGDLARFPHFGHAADVACPDIAILRDRHFEFEFLIAAIWHIAANVPVHAAGPQRRAGQAACKSILTATLPAILQAIN